MSYQLPPDLESEFTLRVRAGNYSTMEQVLRDALIALDARNVEIAAIQEGIDAAERCDVIPFDDFDREFRVRNNISLDA